MAGSSKVRLPLHCPSAEPGWRGSVVFGVVLGTAEEPRMAPLERALPVTADVLQATAPLPPTEVLRFAAPCAQGACHHFASGTCRLAMKLVARLPAVTNTAAPCPIRPHCRWHAQEGEAACVRCPQVVTDWPTLAEEARLAADPDVTA